MQSIFPARGFSIILVYTTLLISNVLNFKKMLRQNVNCYYCYGECNYQYLKRVELVTKIQGLGV